MAISVELTDVLSGFLTASATTANNTKIEEGFAKALSREPAADNAMETVLDMGGYPITNIAYDSDDETSAVTKAIFDTLAADHTAAMNAIQTTTEGFRDEAETFRDQSGAAATSAQASATAAATSESNAATSETNAAASETAAGLSETNAATSATNAQTSYENILSHYYGAYSSDPATDPNGNAVSEGDVYYNTVDNTLKVYDSSEGWLAVISPTALAAPELVWSGNAGYTVNNSLAVSNVTTADVLSFSGHVVDTGRYLIRVSPVAVSAADLYFTVRINDVEEADPTINAGSVYTNGADTYTAMFFSNSTLENAFNHFSNDNASVLYEIVEIYYLGSDASGSNVVSDVFGRTGNVVAEAGDYSADQVSYDTAVSGLTSTDVKGAIDELAAIPDSLGVNQSATLETLNRTLDTTYTNSSSRTISVHIVLDLAAGDEVGLSVNSIFVAKADNTNTNPIRTTIMAIVPPGEDYRLNSTSGTPSIHVWTELK